MSHDAIDLLVIEDNAVLWQGRVDVNDRRYFRLAADTGQFAVGEFNATLRELNEHASTDALTALYNRRHFRDALVRAADEALYAAKAAGRDRVMVAASPQAVPLLHAG